MATVSAVIDREMSAGRAVDLAFGTIRNNPAATIGLALLVGAIPGLIVTYASSFVSSETLDETGPAFWSLLALSIVASMVIAAMTQAFLTRATVAHSEGRKASFMECLRAGLAMFLPLVGLAILYSLAMGIGFVLLLIPGLIIMVAWSVSAPVLIEERSGIFEAIQRSTDLTRGARWKIFCLMIAIGIVSTLASGISDEDPLAGLSNPTYLLLTTLVGTVTSLISGAIQASLYVELRDWKDGPATARLEEVFG